jgi:hypothetical protein
VTSNKQFRVPLVCEHVVNTISSARSRPRIAWLTAPDIQTEGRFIERDTRAAAARQLRSLIIFCNLEDFLPTLQIFGRGHLQ